MGGVYIKTIQLVLLFGTHLVFVIPQIVFRDPPIARPSPLDTVESRVVYPGNQEEDSYCHNTCERLNQNYPDVKCKCDRYCAAMKDCCSDAPFRGRSLSSSKMDCLPRNDEFAVYTITQCKRRWRGSQEVVSNCTRPTDLSSDPIGNVPVTNTMTGATYKNVYCALCNDDSSITFWQIGFNCLFDKNKTTVTYATENIVYNEERGQWGLWLEDTKNGRVFHGCSINSIVPNDLVNTVRRCYGVKVSECPSTWQNPMERRKCREYLDPVTALGVKYRNRHCALCNGANMTDVFCLSIHNRTAMRPNAALPNFAMLMDINSNNCEQGGGKCPCGETYDAFFKKCRKIVELPFR